MTSINLDFINRSNDTSNASVVIFQQNTATDFDYAVVAWKVIKNCGRLDNHPFRFPYGIEISAEDSFGNFTPRLNAEPGQVFDFVQGSSGEQLVLAPVPAPTDQAVELRNQLSKGSISAYAYKDGDLLSFVTNFAPGQKALFEFKPQISVAAVADVDQGDVLSSAILDGNSTVLDVSDMVSADIVMTGGCPGPDAGPLAFHLENIVRPDDPSDLIPKPA